jgi:multisubunit Na+/H+ antiporter MnhB subunit
VVLATAVMLVFLAGQFVVVRRAHPQALAEAAESVGAGGFALIGLTAVLSGVQYLTNTLPLGSPATIASAGTMGLISFCVGVEVAAGMVLIVYELLDQTLLRRSGA